jgi:hypothetical protein
VLATRPGTDYGAILSLDGKRLLYTVVGSKPGQLWALENVLPPAKPAAPAKK